MPQLRSFRLGWQSQNIARFLLYKCCFLSEPVQVADDIGIDFFCTLFETQKHGGNYDLIPRNSFAIQIKSETDSSAIDLSGYLPYLTRLELPYFIGEVNRNELTLTIYSGEFLTPLFAYKGKPVRLFAQLSDPSDLRPDHSNWHSEANPGEIHLLFPKLLVIDHNCEGPNLAEVVAALQSCCSRVLDNIAGSLKKEFSFKGSTPGLILSFAGPESLQYFERNVFNRLAEAFYTLHWAYSVGVEPRADIEKRFAGFQKIYSTLQEVYGEEHLPPNLRDMHSGAVQTFSRPNQP